MNKVIPEITKDGSFTLFVPELNEHYHSVNGAMTESEHVFIQAGLSGFFDKGGKNLTVLEMGFGTGLNALMTFSAAENRDLTIRYTGIELYPLSLDIVDQLNIRDKGDILKKMHQVEWGCFHEISERFFLRKMNVDFTQYVPDEMYDLVYFDAFSPDIRQELWTVEIFRNLFKHMTLGGVFTTYCAKGQVRRDLQSVGFKVERLPGPPGKREMLRAVKEI